MSIVAIGKHALPFIRCISSCEILYEKFHVGWEYPLNHVLKYRNEILALKAPIENFIVITKDDTLKLYKYLQKTNFKDLK